LSARLFLKELAHHASLSVLNPITPDAFSCILQNAQVGQAFFRVANLEGAVVHKRSWLRHFFGVGRGVQGGVHCVTVLRYFFNVAGVRLADFIDSVYFLERTVILIFVEIILHLLLEFDGQTDLVRGLDALTDAGLVLSESAIRLRPGSVLLPLLRKLSRALLQSLKLLNQHRLSRLLSDLLFLQVFARSNLHGEPDVESRALFVDGIEPNLAA